LAELCEGFPFAVVKQDRSPDLFPQEAVLPHQILIPQQKLLVDRPRDLGKQYLQRHGLLHFVMIKFLSAWSAGAKVEERQAGVSAVAVR